MREIVPCFLVWVGRHKREGPGGEMKNFLIYFCLNETALSSS